MTADSEAPRESRATIIEAVKTPLGFFALVVLVVEAILGGTALGTEGGERTLVVWAMVVLILVLVAIVAFFAYARPEALSGVRVPAASLGGVEKLTGYWWQFIYGPIHHPISSVAVSVREDGRLLVAGDACDPAGDFVARWRADSSAYNPATAELVYFWTGTDTSIEDVQAQEFSGVGIFRFETDPSGGIGDQAEGWFSRGDLLRAVRRTAEQEVERVELRRATADEAAILDAAESLKPADVEARKRLIADKYASWRQARGAG